MNKQTEALHKALKVLNCLNNNRVYETAWVKGAINACEEALAQPAQEPVLLNVKTHDDKTYKVEVSAPSWQGLSDDEVNNIYPCAEGVHDFRDIVRAIEQALKEKNYR